MRLSNAALSVALVLASASLAAHAAPSLLRFSGAIGVDPLSAAGGVDTLNVVRGVNPSGRAWILRKLKASVDADGKIEARGAGLLFTSGDVIGTRGGIANVVATLTCGPANATARRFTSAPAPLDLAGDFRISGVLSEDGINPAVLPEVCDNPALLIRSINTATGMAGGWFAVGILGVGDGD